MLWHFMQMASYICMKEKKAHFLRKIRKLFAEFDG